MTSWEYEGQRLTLADVERFIAWHNLVARPIDILSLTPLLTVKTEPSRIENADREYAIIVIVRDRKPVMILDGHHRVHQARRSGELRINAFAIDYHLVPLSWRGAIKAS